MRIGAVLLLALAAGAQENPYLRELKAGHELLTQNEPEKAIAHFARAQHMAPRDWRGYTWECVAHFMRARVETDPKRRLEILGEADAVASQLTKRAGLGFTDPLYLYLRGVILAFREQVKLAYRTLKMGLNAAPDRFAPYREFELKSKLEHACAIQAMTVATFALRARQFEDADVLLGEAEEGLKGTADEERLQRQRAVVCEQLNRYDEAVKRLRRAIELTKSPEIRYELLGNIATIYFQQNRMEEGKAVFAEAPAGASHPELVAAKAMYVYKQALNAPDSEAMDVALRHYRELLATELPRISFRLAEQFTEMILAKVRPRDAEREAELLKEGVRIAQREQELRPECPSLYFVLQRLHRLLGNAELELHYQRLHEEKKKEFESRTPYDHTGRPRCR